MLGIRKDPRNIASKKNFTLPSVVLDNNDGFPIGKAFAVSVLAHPLVIALIWLIIQAILILFALLGIHLALFDKPQPKVRDIEYVLVNQPEQKPINQNTQNRADRNSRAGGKNNPKMAVSEPELQAVRSQAQSSSSAPQQRQVQKKTAHSPNRQMAQDTPVPPRPIPYQKFSRPSMNHPNMFSMSVPKHSRLRSLSPNGGPVTVGPLGAYSPGSNPSPIMGSGHSGRHSGYSAGGGNLGNPGPGNPNGRPGIDAASELDWGPYMRDLQRRIKRNWEPPRGETSKRVVVIFKIGRDGRLLARSIHTSSGSAEADKAALSAIELTAPYRPLPPECGRSNIDIQFTFDYNVNSFSIRRY